MNRNASSSRVDRSPRSPAALVQRALRVAGASVQDATLTCAFPYLEAVTARFAWHFTDAIPHPESPSLLVHALRSAFARAARAQAAAPYRYPVTVAQAYVAGLFAPTPAVVDVVVHSRARQWDPLGRAALADFIAAERPVRIAPRERPSPLTSIDAATVRHCLAARLLTAPDLAALGGHLSPLVSSEDAWPNVA